MTAQPEQSAETVQTSTDRPSAGPTGVRAVLRIPDFRRLGSPGDQRHRRRLDEPDPPPRRHPPHRLDRGARRDGHRPRSAGDRRRPRRRRLRRPLGAAPGDARIGPHQGGHRPRLRRRPVDRPAVAPLRPCRGPRHRRHVLLPCPLGPHAARRASRRPHGRQLPQPDQPSHRRRARGIGGRDPRRRRRRDLARLRRRRDDLPRLVPHRLAGRDSQPRRAGRNRRRTASSPRSAMDSASWPGRGSSSGRWSAPA